MENQDPKKVIEQQNQTIQQLKLRCFDAEEFAKNTEMQNNFLTETLKAVVERLGINQERVDGPTIISALDAALATETEVEEIVEE